MKRVMVLALLTAGAICLTGFAEIGYEGPYAFRKRLTQVHKADMRDYAEKAAANETAFRDGMRITLGMCRDALVRLAAEDFREYLAVSMGVTASVEEGAADEQQAGVTVALDARMPARAYETEVTTKGVAIRAVDARAAAQAFYHLEDVMNLRRAPYLKQGKETRRPMFTTRMTHSGWGIDMFPDCHLSQIAHYGFTSILIFVKDIDRVHDGTRRDVQDIIRRAKRFGLDTYLYSYVLAFVHPSDPGAQAKFESTYGRVAAAYPEAKGIVFVGESCQFPSKDERVLPYCYWEKEKINAAHAKGDRRPLAGWFPCRDYPDWLKAVRGAIQAKSPNMEIVFWSYNWGYHDAKNRLALIDALPTDITLQATFEMFEDYELKNGLKSRTSDYSLAWVGPGRYFTTEAIRAKERGINMHAMVNTGGHTWDFGTIGFDPFPYQWQKRFNAVVKAHQDWNLAGLMENHHYGWFPSFISELAKETYTEGGMPFDAHLAALTARDYGRENVARITEVWKSWSEAITFMHATSENQYGPFRYGPAYPFNAMEPDFKETDLPIKPMYLSLNYRRYASPDALLVKQLEMLNPMAERFAEGARVFREVAAQAKEGRIAENAGRMALQGDYMSACCRTAIHVKEGQMAERAKDRARVTEIAKREYTNCKAALDITRRDSRLGWEPTMLYRGGPDAISWKMDYLKKHYGITDSGK